MKRILKFNLNDELLLPPHPDDRILHIGDQHGSLMLWAETEATAVPGRRFTILATGNELHSGYAHIGTVFQPPYVWHVYELTGDA